MNDSRLAQIESDLRGFLRNAYPDIEIKAEYWSDDPSRIAIYFTEAKLRDLYPRQRYHYLIHQIPEEYYRSTLEDAVWFELSPGESPEEIEYPDDELIAAIKQDVLKTLQSSGFFGALDGLLYSEKASREILCSGDFRQSKDILKSLGFEQSEWSDVFNVLMCEGAFCDCEILYNVATESRLRSEYWKAGHTGE